MKKFVFIILILSFWTVIFSEPKEEILKRLENRFSSIETFRATFKEKIIPVIGEAQSFEGTIDIARSHNLRMETTTPEKELILYNGEIVWVYFPDEKYCLKYKISNDNILSKIPNFIFEPFKTLIVDTLYSETGFIFIRFSTPKDDEFFESVELTFTRKTMLPVSLILRDKTGNRTEYNFSDVKVNSKNKINFSFTPPTGTEIIEKMLPYK